jgi:hypothetical protein
LESRSIAATTILKELNLSTLEVDPRSISLDQQKANEKHFVHFCLEKLKSNDFLPEHREVWEDFITIRKDKVNSLEDLFNLANAIMIAIASSNESQIEKPTNYRTCSLLPLSEKQIPLSYDQYTNAEDQAQKRVHIETEIKNLRNKASKLHEHIRKLNEEVTALSQNTSHKNTESIIAKLRADKEKIDRKLQVMNADNPEYTRLSGRTTSITKQISILEGTSISSLLTNKVASINNQIDQLTKTYTQLTNEIRRQENILLLAMDQKYPSNRVYPKIFQCSLMERYIPYSHKIALPFYGNTSPGTVSNLISIGAIERAQHNLGLFATGKPTPTFQQFISNASNPTPGIASPRK